MTRGRDFVAMGPELTQGLDRLADDFRRWGASAGELLIAHRELGERWRGEAVKRVPVETGNLRERIIARAGQEGDVVYTECGTNVEGYPEFLEFGTQHIAGGQVLALGDGPITDQQAIHSWPAKDDNAIAETKTEATQAGGPQEQMPWLRPAFQAVKDEWLETWNEIFQPPRQGA